MCWLIGLVQRSRARRMGDERVDWWWSASEVLEVARTRIEVLGSFTEAE